VERQRRAAVGRRGQLLPAPPFVPGIERGQQRLAAHGVLRVLVDTHNSHHPLPAGHHKDMVLVLLLLQHQYYHAFHHRRVYLVPALEEVQAAAPAGWVLLRLSIALPCRHHLEARAAQAERFAAQLAISQQDDVPQYSMPPPHLVALQEYYPRLNLDAAVIPPKTLKEYRLMDPMRL
jgi:hypothetical protein